MDIKKIQQNMFLDFIWSLLGRIVFFTGTIGAKNSFPKPLSKEEEERYLALAAQGNKEAKDTLVKHNMRLVAHIVKKYTGAAETDDLISVGSIGLIKAIGTYQPGHGTALATYTARCIENEILMHFRSSKKLSQEISFDEPIEVDSEGNPLTLMDIIAVDDTIVDEIDTNNKLKRLVKIIHNMPEGREKQIIVNRYGLNGRPPLTQREVAKKLNISRSYVSRIEKRLLQEFKELL